MLIKMVLQQTKTLPTEFSNSLVRFNERNIITKISLFRG